MLRPLQDLFDRLVARPAPGVPHGAHEIQLATAVLLVEVMCADASLADVERASVLRTLQARFDLTPDELARLMELAQARARAAHDLHTFTSALNGAYDMADKIAVIESMWRVAYADDHLAAHEQHILWRVADLLHVPHSAYIHAKLRAREGAAGA